MRVLDHPNVVRFYEFYDHDNYIYMVMEYCPGKQLFDVIREHLESPRPIYTENEV